MRIAVISDIHSNIYALDKVIEDIKSKNVDMIICTGDLVGYGTRPNEVIHKMKEEKILTIMGNYDDAIGNLKIVCGCDYKDPKDAEKASLSMHFTSYETTDENKKYLRNLPKEATFTFNNKTIRFVHGSTRVINEYLKENSKEAEEVMNELVEDILVCGHTHIPYAKYYGEKLLVNAGSVGKPKTNKPDANYVIIEICDTNVEVEIIEVSYNFEKMAKEIAVRGHRDEASLGIRFVKHTRTEFTETSRNGWSRTVMDNGTIVLMTSPYQSRFAGKVIEELLLQKLPYLRNFTVSVYEIYDKKQDLIFIKNPEKAEHNCDVSLYVSAGDLLSRKTGTELLKRHKDYWHDYGNGKYDDATEKFLVGPFVQSFLAATQEFADKEEN